MKGYYLEVWKIDSVFLYQVYLSNSQHIPHTCIDMYKSLIAIVLTWNDHNQGNINEMSQQKTLMHSMEAIRVSKGTSRMR